MNQPPKFRGESTSVPRQQSPPKQSQPQWRRPRGVAAGTWDYVNERSIADHYDAFVADTPLCQLDAQLLQTRFPAVGRAQTQQQGNSGEANPLILDLGCGSGRASLPLAERGYDVVAVDLSIRMLQVLMHKSRNSTPPHVHPLRANLVQLDCLASESADHAICMFSTIGMIQGRANRHELLRHVARILRPGGNLLIHVHNRWAALREPAGIRRLTTSWLRSLRDPERDFGDSTYAYRGLDNMFMHRFSRRELMRDLRDCGWQIETVSPVSIDGTRVDTSAWIPGGYIVAAHV